MKKLLLMCSLLLVNNLYAIDMYPILDEEKCELIMEEETEYNKEKRYHRSCLTASMASDTSSELPEKLDSMTELSNVIAIRDLLVYNYRLVLPKKLKKQQSTISKNLKEMLINSNCSETEVKEYIIDNGITIVHSYYLKDGELFTTLKINKNTCKTALEKNKK